MNLNPEFRRNLWLELTPSRLVGMPLILGIIFVLAYLQDDRQYGESVARAALVLYGLLAFLWGTRLASESLVAEIREHTWDSQRMSVIEPWSMTWGKLLGSTVYPWYGAFICLLVYLTSRPTLELSPVETVVLMLGSGLLGQAIGLLASLLATRKNQRYGRFQTTAFLVLGAGCAVTVLSWPLTATEGVSWYGRIFADRHFVLVSLVVFLAWAVFGIYRLIRAELQLRSRPLAWTSFVLFLMIYIAGFLGDGTWPHGPGASQQRLLGAFLTAVLLAYAMLFCERKDPVIFRRLLQSLARRDWQKAVIALPLWLCTLPFVFFSGLLLVVVDLVGGTTEGMQLVGIPVLAMILFLLRDIALLLYLNLGRVPKRADMLTVLWLVLLYGVIPAILAALGMVRLAAVFWPAPGQPAAIILPAALLQVVVACWFLARRWRGKYTHY